MDLPARVVDRLKKLLALTNSGNKHEASNANDRIVALCKKHGVDANDFIEDFLSDEPVEMHWFRYDNSQSKTVLINTIARVLNGRQTYKSARRQRQTGVECTKSEAAEVALWWGVMRESFKQYLNDAPIAFIMANNLYSKPAEDDEREPLTDAERAELIRQARMADGITPSVVNKALTYDSEFGAE